ncbi:hypothetical protein ACE7GA_03705 [Roseomonas sp. CCTCC AB2023176]|uniref:hypothetical protein n=1 Tax=Roseomonas sp. CCTCC AB2023176 TaxID=3342640 RepID=UPI0035DC9984
MDPVTWGLFAWEAGWVFSVRSMELMFQAPADAAETLGDMALEKGRAFAEGWFDAGLAAMHGADAMAVLAAAAAPARDCVRANLRGLGRR